MKQYCRYCNNMCCGNGNWCSEHKRTSSDAYIKATNTCDLFEFNPIDALGENARGYVPREKKEDGEQISWASIESGFSRSVADSRTKEDASE